jgi:hypothetical protein
VQQPDIRKISQIRLPKVSQIGILVKDIPEAVQHYTKLLNIGPWYRSGTVKHECIYRGEPINADEDIVLAFPGRMTIELIEAKYKGECIYSDMQQKSGSGIHHFGMAVLGFDKKLEQLKANGIEVIQSGVITTKGSAITRYAYLDTTRQCGILTEIFATTLLGVPIPHNKLIMDIGCITGDVERVKR